MKYPPMQFYVFRFDATTFRSTHRKYDNWRAALEECYGGPCECEFVMVATASQQLKAMREPATVVWQKTEFVKVGEKYGWRIKPLAKDWTPMNLDRVFKIDVCADGIVTVRGPGEPRRNDAALPVHSCDTREDAKALMILVCKLTYDGQYLLPPEIFDRKLSQAEAVKLLPDVGALFLRMEQVVEAKKAK